MTETSAARSSRDLILRLLRSAPHTANELADSMDISPQAVRDQLRTLEEKGWIAVGRLQRDTGGKPAREYALTVEGEESFEKPYLELLAYLVEELGERLGVGAKRELFEAVGRRIGADLAESEPRAAEAPEASSPRALRARLAAAVEVLNALGGAAEVVETGKGLRIRSDGCPLSGLVLQDPDACHVARALVETLAGVPVRETCDRSERPRCRFAVGERD